MRFSFFLCIISVSATSQKPFKWPGNKKAAIVLTYDDAVQSQLNIAIPQLNSFQFKGTFFLTGNLTEKDIVRWRNAAKDGHEWGNHTLYHPCRSSVVSSVNRYQSENYIVEIILRDISILNNFLFAIDSNSSRTYAYPCSETSVGGKDDTDTLKRSALIKYARSGGDSNSIVTDFNHLNKFVVPSCGFANNPDALQFISFAKKVQKAGGMGVFMFHNVGGDYLNVSADAHKNLLQYLQDQ